MIEEAEARLAINGVLSGRAVADVGQQRVKGLPVAGHIQIAVRVLPGVTSVTLVLDDGQHLVYKGVHFAPLPQILRRGNGADVARFVRERAYVAAITGTNFTRLYPTPDALMHQSAAILVNQVPGSGDAGQRFESHRARGVGCSYANHAHGIVKSRAHQYVLGFAATRQVLLDAQSINLVQVHVVRIVGVAASALKIDLAEIAAQTDVAHNECAPVDVLVRLADISWRQVAHAHGDGRDFVGGRVVIEDGVIGGGDGADDAHARDGGGDIGGNVNGVWAGGQVNIYTIAVRFAKGKRAI